MHQLARRVALATTLPLAMVAPVVLLAQPAQAFASSIDLTLSTNTPVYGQVVTASAHVTDGTNAVTEGCVEFTVSLTGQEPVMDVTVPVDASGVATTPFLKNSETGLPLDINTSLTDWNVHASFIELDGGTCSMPFASLFDDATFDITKAGSSIAVVPSATALSAKVTSSYPGGAVETSARPDGGAVTFTVDGANVGTNDAVDGVATISYAVPPGSHTITASYTGDTHYLPASTATKTRKDPILQAVLVSTFAKSKAGWYHTAVEVWFSCRPQGSELTAECPADVKLKKNGKGQSVTRTVTALDGGTATVTVRGIDIDRVKPTIKVDGRSCTATDKLSGVKGRCHLTVANGRYTATATDKAGNIAVKHGKLH